MPFKIVSIVLLLIGLGGLWWIWFPKVTGRPAHLTDPHLYIGWLAIALFCLGYGWWISTSPVSPPSSQVSSSNQQGGVIADTTGAIIINNFTLPPPAPTTKLEVKLKEVVQFNTKTADGYESIVLLAIEPPAHMVGILQITICKHAITDIKLSPYKRGGVFMSGGTSVKDGCAFTSIQNASGTFALTIISSTPLISPVRITPTIG